METRLVTLVLVALVLALVIGAGLGYLFGYDHGRERATISSFEDCKAAGYPIMESDPERCATPDGRTFAREAPQSEMPSVEEPVFCTMDAKICPDGSAVGRVGPGCEFAPCP